MLLMIAAHKQQCLLVQTWMMFPSYNDETDDSLCKCVSVI